jgi:hypothetical protein
MWGVLIAVGAILVAYGNINFNLARDRERAQAASEKALSMLKVECNNNLNRLTEMRQAFSNGRFMVDGFETTAWSTVSSGGLLIQLDQETLGKVAEVYYLLELSNQHQSRLLDLTYGAASALSSAGQLRQEHIDFIKHTLDKVEPKLSDIAGRVPAKETQQGPRLPSPSQHR